MKKNYLIKLWILSLVVLSYGCGIKQTHDSISFNNMSDFVVYAQYSPQKETIKMTNKGSHSGFTLFSYDKDNEGISDAEFLAKTQNLSLFIIQNNDTIYADQSKYNSMDKWQRHVAYDMDIRFNQFWLEITNDFFAEK